MPFNRLESDVCPDAFFQWNSLNYKKNQEKRSVTSQKFKFVKLWPGLVSIFGKNKLKKAPLS